MSLAWLGRDQRHKAKPTGLGCSERYPGPPVSCHLCTPGCPGGQDASSGTPEQLSPLGGKGWAEELEEDSWAVGFWPAWQPHRWVPALSLQPQFQGRLEVKTQVPFTQC